MNRLADAQELAPTGRALDRDPFALELIKNALVALADEMALTVLPHGALVRREGGPRLLDRVVPGGRPADRAGNLPAVSPGRHAVRGEGRAGRVRRTHPARRPLHHQRPVRRQHAPSRHRARQAHLRRRRAVRLLGGARAHDGHRRAHSRWQRQRLDRDLPGRIAHPAVAAVARRRARRDDVPPHRAQRARARQGPGRHPLAGRRVRRRRARDAAPRDRVTARRRSSSTAATSSTTPSGSRARRSRSFRRARGGSWITSTATAWIRIRSASRPR